MAGGIEHMVIETVLFIVFVVFVVIVWAAIVKAYEWHQDVLYGPLHEGASIETEATMIAISFAPWIAPTPRNDNGLAFMHGHQSRDAQLPAGLCADRFGGATTAVAGYTKNSSLRGLASRTTGRGRATDESV